MSGVGPAAEVLLFRQKDPKPVTPRPSHLINRTQGIGGRANSLCSHKARQDKERPIRGWAAGVGLWIGAVFNVVASLSLLNFETRLLWELFKVTEILLFHSLRTGFTFFVPLPIISDSRMVGFSGSF